MITCFWLTLCQYSSERGPWDVDLRSRYILNADIINHFLEVRLKMLWELWVTIRNVTVGSLYL